MRINEHVCTDGWIFLHAPNIRSEHGAKVGCFALDMIKAARGRRARWFAGTLEGELYEQDINRFLIHTQPHSAVLIDTRYVRPSMPDTLSVLLPTIGGPKLVRTIESVLNQDWAEGDEFVIINDGDNEIVDRIVFPYLKKHRQIKYIVTPQRGNDWGHTPRNVYMPLLRTEYCSHIDDDDVMLPDAIATIRKNFKATRRNLYLYKLHWPAHDGQEEGQRGLTLWKEKRIFFSNVSTQMVVHRLDLSSYGFWTPIYGGDFEFISFTSEINDRDEEWREELIVHMNP